MDSPCPTRWGRLWMVALLVALFPGNAPGTYRAVLYNGTHASVEHKLIAMTLAGIVNRDSARIYLLNVYETWSYAQTDERWRDLYRSRGGVQFDSVTSIVALVDRFRPYIAGGVMYDPNRWFANFPGQNFRYQAEYASLIGGLTNRLPVTPILASGLNLTIADSILCSDPFDGDSAVWVPGRLDAPGHAWNNTLLTEEQRYLTLLDWGVRVLLPRCNPREFYLREITDWAVARRMFQVNLAGTDDLDLNSMPAPRADILERVLTFLHDRNPGSIFHIYGWIRPEPMTQWFACFGSSFHETLLANLSWHASFPVPPRSFQRPAQARPDTVVLEKRYYLLFVASEGDASNWVFGFHSGAWLSPERGSVPLGWGWNLHLFSLCPFVGAYYCDSATPADGFLSVTSPLGYAYPDLWGDGVWNGAVDSTRRLMETFNAEEVYGYKHYAGAGTMVYRGKTISNSFNFTRYGSFQSAIGATMTIVYDPIVPSHVPFTTYGPVMFNHVADGTFYSDASDLNAMASRILTNLKSRAAPAFLLAGYQRMRQDDFATRSDPSSADMTVPRLAQLVGILKADPAIGGEIRVVTPEVFSILLRRQAGVLAVEPETERATAVALLENYPNPFNASTTIRIRITDPRSTVLRVYDLLGKEVAALVKGDLPAGEHLLRFDGSSLSSGTYFCRLEAGGVVLTRPILLLR